LLFIKQESESDKGSEKSEHSSLEDFDESGNSLVDDSTDGNLDLAYFIFTEVFILKEFLNFLQMRTQFLVPRLGLLKNQLVKF